MVRDKARSIIQQIMEEEVTELLNCGGLCSADNGIRQSRGGGDRARVRLQSTASGSRGIEERFESRVLPSCSREATFVQAVSAWAGESMRVAMRGCKVNRDRSGGCGRDGRADFATGRSVRYGRDLREGVPIWWCWAVDARRAIAAVGPETASYCESIESWSEVLRDLKASGIEAPLLLMEKRSDLGHGEAGMARGG